MNFKVFHILIVLKEANIFFIEEIVKLRSG